jgi:hypothetical protein
MYHFLWLTNERPLAAFTCVWARDWLFEWDLSDTSRTYHAVTR